jgi:hypothetical protein
VDQEKVRVQEGGVWRGEKERRGGWGREEVERCAVAASAAG